jgi:glycine betaine transporter
MTSERPENQSSTNQPEISFRRVMIAVDENETSQRALRVGVELAARFDAEVALLHVTNTTLGFSPELGVFDDRLRDELTVKGTALLEHLSKGLPERLHVSRLLREGDPAVEIVKEALKWDSDVIVVGTHARSGVARFFLGSTAESVVRRAHCPVLTVGHVPPARSADPPGATREAMPV